MNTDSKLPAWPDDLMSGAEACDEVQWLHKSLTAAMARIEALKEYAAHDQSCNKYVQNNWGQVRYDVMRECDCGLKELLAACQCKAVP